MAKKTVSPAPATRLPAAALRPAAPAPTPAPARATPAATPPTAPAASVSTAAARTVTATTTRPTVSAAAAAGTVTRVPEIVQPQYVPAKFSARVLRPRDLLALEFTFVNLRVQKPQNSPAELQRINRAQPAYIVVGFPSQHLMEEAFFETANETPIKDPPADKPTQQADPDKGAGSETPTAPPVNSRLSGPSRLVFRVPAGTETLPYALDELLALLVTFELNVAPTATPPDPGRDLPKGAFSDLLTSPSLDRGAVVPSVVSPAAATPAARTVAARIEASNALAASLVAETQNQWYAKRSPLSRAGAVQAEIVASASLLEKLRPLLAPRLAAPGDLQTAIEAPTRLILSPHALNAWVHAANPVASSNTGRIELWHTRLAVRLASGAVTERPDFRRTVRAIWALGPASEFKPEAPLDSPPHANTPFRTTLDAFDRHNLVHLSANQHISLPGPAGKRYHPRPIEVDNLMLTSLGAWLDLRGSWTPPNGLSVENWRHRATLGRDHYVRVVYAGSLYPFGHKASLIKVTERKFHGDRPGNTAYLRQRMFIVVREPFRLIGNSGLKRANGEALDLQMPFKSARIGTLVTPNLDKPEDSDLVVNGVPQLQSLFWPQVGGSPFAFQMQLEDEAGAIIDLTCPLLFLGNELLTPPGGFKPGVAEAARTSYNQNNAQARARRRRPLRGQRVQLAPSSKPGDTRFEIDEFEFNLDLVGGQLVPFMAAASASIPALKHLARSQTKPDVRFPSLFLRSAGGFATSGANRNPGEVFLELVQSGAAKLDFSQQGDRAGGFLAPNLSLSGLSRKLGPVGGPIETIAQTGLEPTAFFGDLGDLLPKLFGCIKITDILDSVGLGDLGKMPRFVTENLTAAQALLGDLQRIQGHLGALQGQLPGLGAQANALATAASHVVTRLQALLGDPLSGPKRDALKNDFADFVTKARTLHGSLGGLAVPEDLAFARTQLELLLGKVVAGLANASEVVAMVDRIADTLENLNELRVKFEWRPPLKNWPASKPVFEINPGGGLVIAVELAAQSGASKEPSMSVACRLQKFDLNLINPVANFMKLKFRQIEFTASSQRKPDVNVDFGGIEFVGVLSFVETLRTLIPLDGFSDPPYLEVSEQGVEAGFSLGLPNIAIGVFSLSNLSLGASLTVPFIGNQPLSVRFNFCERSDPFRLTVWVFGGGGFFAVTATPAGVQILEAAFEFGASVSIDFGVASGGVSVMAGVYYRMEGEEASLTGYFNLKGRVSVLGLISASLELSLELTYEFSSGKCKGRASLIIEVEVLLFSASVEVVCERKFKGSNGDPSFAQIMAPYADPETEENVDPWAEYCNAYAA